MTARAKLLGIDRADTQFVMKEVCQRCGMMSMKRQAWDMLSVPEEVTRYEASAESVNKVFDYAVSDSTGFRATILDEWRCDSPWRRSTSRGVPLKARRQSGPEKAKSARQSKVPEMHSASCRWWLIWN